MTLFYYKVIKGKYTEHCYTYETKDEAIKEAKARAKRIKGTYTEPVIVKTGGVKIKQ